MPNDAAAADFNDLKKKERIKSISYVGQRKNNWFNLKKNSILHNIHLFTLFLIINRFLMTLIFIHTLFSF